MSDYTRRGVLALFGGAACLSLAGCEGVEPLRSYADGSEFKGFNHQKNTLVFFASANRIDICAEGADVVVQSMPSVLEDYQVKVFMPNFENASKTETLDGFRRFLNHANFDLIIGPNDAVNDIAKKNGAEYLFDRNGDVMIHTPDPFVLKAGESRMERVSVPGGVDEFIRLLGDNFAAVYGIDEIRFG